MVSNNYFELSLINPEARDTAWCGTKPINKDKLLTISISSINLEYKELYQSYMRKDLFNSLQ